MKYYIQELRRLKEICFSNKIQIDMMVNTKKYIDTNFEKDINVDFLAHLRFTTKYHLIRVFKKYHGLTPRQYLIDKRIEQSKKLLKNGMTVTETCYSVGFKSLGSFSTLFKTKTGQSPTEFQKEQFSRSKIASEY